MSIYALSVRQCTCYSLSVQNCAYNILVYICNLGSLNREERDAAVADVMGTPPGMTIVCRLYKTCQFISCGADDRKKATRF